MEDAHQKHGVVDIPLELVLLAGHANVDQHPANESGPELTKVLPVKVSKAGILGTTHPKVVYRVSCGV